MAALMVVLGAIWYRRAQEEDRVSTARTAVTTSTPGTGENDIRVDAWIDDSRVARGSQVAFWISIQNTSKEPDPKKPTRTITGVSILTFRHHSFGVPPNERPCWRNGVPVCTDLEKTSAALPRDLKAQEAMTVEGHLIAGEIPGSYALSAVVGWKDASGSLRRTPISLGPVTVENEERQSRATMVKAAQTFFKDLGIALVLLWLGVVVKRIEEDREEVRKNADERNTRIRETWTEMLPKVHENAEKYYMPVMSFAALTVKYYYGPDANRDYCFFFYFRFLAAMKKMFDSIGGFYLSAREGENVIGALWDMIRDAADARFDRAPRERAQKIFAELSTFDDLQAPLRSQPFLRKIRSDFVSHVHRRTFDADVIAFQLFDIVLTYETNCSYVFWYRKMEPFPLQAFTKLRNELKWQRPLDDKKYDEVIKQLDAYTSTLQARQKALEADLQQLG